MTFPALPDWTVNKIASVYNKNNMCARISINIPSVTGVFKYALSPDTEGVIGAGHLVTVAFDKQILQRNVFRQSGEPSIPGPIYYEPSCRGK
jgi:hypothetical protein